MNNPLKALKPKLTQIIKNNQKPQFKTKLKNRKHLIA